MRQAAKATSFKEASDDLHELADLSISSTHLHRLTERVGSEWARTRDTEVRAFREGKLPRDYKKAPACCAVMLDAGTYQTRASDCGRGVTEPGWRHSKVACLQTYRLSQHQSDPQPVPPEKFLDRQQVKRLSQQMKARGKVGATAADQATAKPKPKRRSSRQQRRRLVKTVVATTRDHEEFGWQVAAEVHRRGLDRATKKACVGDGASVVWSVYQTHLAGAGFVAILDFVHLLVHLYAAAQASGGAGTDQAWELYVQWLSWAWAGKVALLLGALRLASQKRGQPPADAREDDPRVVLSDTVRYVENNRERMKYPHYRKEGLPISSAPVESTIKQINRRVKGTEKFWYSEGAEAVLQVRAAYLSEDERAEKFWRRPRPPGRCVGSGRLGRQ